MVKKTIQSWVLKLLPQIFEVIGAYGRLKAAIAVLIMPSYLSSGGALASVAEVLIKTPVIIN